jgi:hypothetical protein
MLSRRRAMSLENRLAHIFDKNSINTIPSIGRFKSSSQKAATRIPIPVIRAWVGYPVLPPAWRNGLGNRVRLLQKCERICSVWGDRRWIQGFLESWQVIFPCSEFLMNIEIVPFAASRGFLTTTAL